MCMSLLVLLYTVDSPQEKLKADGPIKMTSSLERKVLSIDIFITLSSKEFHYKEVFFQIMKKEKD